MEYFRREIKWLLLQKKQIFTTAVFMVLFVVFTATLYQGQMNREATIEPLSLGWIDQDKSFVSQLIFANLKEDDALSRFLVVEKGSKEVIEEKMNKGELFSAVLLEEGFGDSLYYYGKAKIQVLLNQELPFQSELLMEVLEAYSGFVQVVDNTSYSYYLAMKEYAKEPLPKNFLETSSSEWMLMALSKGSFYEEKTVGTFPSSQSQIYFVVAFSVFFLFILSSHAIEEVVYIKEIGVQRRSKLIPKWTRKFLLSKFVIAWGCQTIFFFFLFLFLGKQFGLWVAPGTVFLAVSLVSLGTLLFSFGLAGIFPKTETYMTVSNVWCLLGAFLGGAFFPITRMNESLRKVSMLTPNYSYTKWILQGMTGQAMDKEIGGIFLWLLVALVAFCIGFFCWKRERI